MHYWLLKSEPNAYSIDDLARDGQTFWDGVRNFQARNLLRDDFAVGDQVLFYHSNVQPMAIVGQAEVVQAGYPDFTAWDPKSHHPDPRSTPEQPIWYMVDIRFTQKFNHPLTLNVAKTDPQLDGLMLTKRGSRLSVQSVSEAHFKRILELCA